jgi:hypothetical protein
MSVLSSTMYLIFSLSIEIDVGIPRAAVTIVCVCVVWGEGGFGKRKEVTRQCPTVSKHLRSEWGWRNQQNETEYFHHLFICSFTQHRSTEHFLYAKNYFIPQNHMQEADNILLLRTLRKSQVIINTHIRIGECAREGWMGILAWLVSSWRN